MTEHAGTTDRDHAILAALGTISEALDAAAHAPTWSLGQSDCRRSLLALAATMARMSELQHRVVGQAVSVEAGEATGAASTATWWAHETRQVPASVHAVTRFATTLQAHPATQEAMSRGEVLLEQARVIADAVDNLPDDADVRERCEKHLIAEAAHFDAKALRILGRRVLQVIDPDAADAHEAKLLDDEERKAAKAASFSMQRDGSGTVRGHFAISELHASMLEKALRALAAPSTSGRPRGLAPTTTSDRPSTAWERRSRNTSSAIPSTTSPTQAASRPRSSSPSTSRRCSAT